ncbi:hypothetical protein AAFF_G00213110 [Aldrovandia affinis]|uniref:Tubulin polyglutamylase TTLL4 n=1 Tax=Aldrovandia affinis TaxID=143900 RepID=A0AAD7RH30_9TELE|nr:hypothetical protein AAFF_G00213110 [Aldrovandia affinis]
MDLKTYKKRPLGRASWSEPDLQSYMCPAAMSPPSSSVERTVSHTQAPREHTVQLHVRLAQPQQFCVSGTSAHRAYHAVPAASPKVSVADKVLSSYASANGFSRGGSASSVASSATQYSRDSISACQSSCRRAASNNNNNYYNYRSFRQLGSLQLQLRPTLLSKRSVFSQRAVYSAACPSWSKATSQKSSAVTECIMPTDQSLPWSGVKLRATALTTANGTSLSGPEPREPKPPFYYSQDSLSYYHGNKGAGQTERRFAHSTVPLMEQCQDAMQEPIREAKELQPLDSMLTANLDLAGRPSQCHVGSGGARGLGRAREDIFRVPLTAAMQKLMGSHSHPKNRPVNGLTGPPGSDSEPPRIVESMNTGAAKTLRSSASLVPPAKPPPRCLAKGDEKPSCVPKDTSGAAAFATRGSSCTGVHPQVSQAPAIAGVLPGDAERKGAHLQQPSVNSVTNQISAIRLTKESSAPLWQGDVSPVLPLPDEHGAMGPRILDPETVATSVDDGLEEELPDDLEYGCSGDGDDDCSCASIDDCSSATSTGVSSNVEEPVPSVLEKDKVKKPALVPSLFPLTPPTLYFGTAKEKVEMLPEEQRALLKWKMSSVTPNVVKHTVARSHFKVTKKNYDWLGCWGHHMKSPGFRTIREYQKLNHFPGSFQIGRKDRLWRNLSKMQVRFGRLEFSFFPRSFVLPQDIKLLRKVWDGSGSRQKWIIKPPASARGIGIQVIHKWSQLPSRRPLLVQKYIHKPYLISGNKFDLRIYVYVSSYDPLRIYIFSDGLVRFASCKYSSSMKSLSNKFMHLTNYSVNKKNSEYQSNSDEKACQGHKWALKALWHYLGARGVNTVLIWERIKDIVIKTIIAADPYVNSLVKMHVRSAYSCHELFGFDVMLDENLKPWLLEVNISPSLHSNTALDARIKGQMIRDLMNLAGFVLPQSEDVGPARSSSSCSSCSSLCGGEREKPRHTGELLFDEKVKRAHYMSQSKSSLSQDFYSTILDVLSPNDVRALTETEDELLRQGDFERVFPSATSSRYLRFFENPRYLNILLDQWEHKYPGTNRIKGINLLRILCQKGVHLGITSESAQPWTLMSASTLKAGSCGNLSIKEEPIRSSVVVSHTPSAQPPDDEDQRSGASSPPDTGSSTPTGGCSSLSSESLNARDSA